MLYYSVNISCAHWYKEELFKMRSCKHSESARKSMKEWIESSENCGLPQLEKCACTVRNWYCGILNSFDTSTTNGFIKGCNNKIKVLKRNAYGYQNFKRFRNRILHMFFPQRTSSKQATAY